MEETIEGLVERLRHAKEFGRKCTLLIGAGCSFSAEIPLAPGFVEEIKAAFPAAYGRAREKTYQQCMDQLDPGVRRDLIGKYIDKAKINWAHIGIAQLLKNGYIGRILTTNFDPLIIRACALVGKFPAVYDFAASQAFHPDTVPDESVFFLHGQRSGFKLIVTDDQCDQHFELTKPLFASHGLGRLWIVIGYSGESDPLFNHFLDATDFVYGLVWVGYRRSDPAAHVRQLLEKGNGTRFLRGFDADWFFTELARRLNCFPPSFVGSPLDYLEEMLETLVPYSLPGEEEKIDIKEIAKRRINSYREQEEKPEKEETRNLASKSQAVELLLKGDYEAVVAIWEETKPSSIMEEAAWAYTLWGNVLLDQARTQQGEEAGRLFTLAGEKYRQALAIKPQMHEALNNWGHALSVQAKTRQGEEADRLFALAAEKCQQALAIKPDLHQALNNWGIALLGQARIRQGGEADRLFVLAGEKYRQALAIEPQDYETLYNWGNALLDQARTRQGEEAGRLFALAGEKYRQALAIKPQMHEALNNWGNALSDQAKARQGEEADRLFALAGEKYRQALAIKPGYREALNNWGNALSDQAKTKRGEEADRLLRQAEETHLQAEEIDPGSGSYDLACIAALQGDELKCRQWLEKSAHQRQLPPRKHMEDDPDFDSVREKDWFQEILKKAP